MNTSSEFKKPVKKYTTRIGQTSSAWSLDFKNQENLFNLKKPDIIVYIPEKKEKKVKVVNKR